MFVPISSEDMCVIIGHCNLYRDFEILKRKINCLDNLLLFVIKLIFTFKDYETLNKVMKKIMKSVTDLLDSDLL